MITISKKKFKYSKKAQHIVKKKPESIMVNIVFLFFVTSLYVCCEKKLIYGSALYAAVAISLFCLFGGQPIWRKVKENEKRSHYLNSDIYKIDHMEGTEFEEYLKYQFIKRGWKVSLTPTSGDYGVDLVCKKGHDRLAIQAKRYKGLVGVEAVQQVVAGKNVYKCTKTMVITNSRFTPNAKELAKKNNVELWDRSDICKNFRI